MTRHSTHPCAVRIREAITQQHFPEPVRSFVETAGCGMEGTVAGKEIWIGSAAWLASKNVSVPPGALTHSRGSPREEARVESAEEQSERPEAGSCGQSAPPLSSTTHIAINGKHRGCYVLASALRPHMGQLLRTLSGNYELALLSGDNEKERKPFTEMFGNSAQIHFN